MYEIKFDEKGNVLINVTLSRVRVTIVAVEKKYSECVSVALVIQHAKHMGGIILLSVACPAVPCLSALSRKRHHIRDKVIEHKTFSSFPLQNLSNIFLILRRIERDIVINVHMSSRKIPVILCIL